MGYIFKKVAAYGQFVLVRKNFIARSTRRVRNEFEGIFNSAQGKPQNKLFF